MSQSKQVSRTAWWLFLIISIIGLGLAAHLTYVHIGVHTITDFSSGCNINQTFNCESVALSPYSVFLGIPVSLWGGMAYLFFLVMSILGIRRKRPEIFPLHGLLLLTTIFGFVVSLSLAYISYTQIKALCPTCMGTYAVNLFLVIIAIAIYKGEEVAVGQCITQIFRWLPKGLLLILVGGICLAVLIAVYPKYWKEDAQRGRLSKILQGADHGHHWIGAKNPSITIVEFADYECYYCRKMHYKLRRYVQRFPTIIRLIHRHYPLDNKCNSNIKSQIHLRACMLARAAYCAGKQNQFWKANDLFYKQGKKMGENQAAIGVGNFGVKQKAFKECLASDEAHEAILKDLQAGEKLGIRGTPFFTMNGKAYRKGYIPDKEIIALIQATAVQTKKKGSPVKTRHIKIKPSTR